MQGSMGPEQQTFGRGYKMRHYLLKKATVALILSVLIVLVLRASGFLRTGLFTR